MTCNDTSSRTTSEYRLTDICGWGTLLARNSDGTTVASIVLPSRQLGTGSVCLADVHRVTGCVKAINPPAPAFVRAFTVREAHRPDWRRAAERNASLVASAGGNRGRLIFLDSLRRWVSSTGTDAVRFFMGGDMTGAWIGTCMCEAARSVPNMLCFAVSSDQDVLDTIWEGWSSGKVPIPGNMVFLTEDPVNGTMGRHGFGSVSFSRDGGQCELSAYPGDGGMTVHIPEEGEYLLNEPYNTNWIDKLRDIAARQRKERQHGQQ